MIDIILYVAGLWAFCWVTEDLLFGRRPPWQWRHRRGACGKRVCEACD